MSARAKLADVTYVSTTPATACTVFGPTGDVTHYVVVAEREGFALVQPERCQGWAQVAIGDLDLADADGIDEVVAAAIQHAFEPRCAR
jgi:hypothetical protein